MPLKSGCRKPGEPKKKAARRLRHVISSNIRELLKSGRRSAKQAIAIAMKKAGIKK